jgi:hypothetical protein
LLSASGVRVVVWGWKMVDITTEKNRGFKWI